MSQSKDSGGIMVGCQTYDHEVVGSTLGQVAITWLLLGYLDG